MIHEQYKHSSTNFHEQKTKLKAKGDNLLMILVADFFMGIGQPINVNMHIILYKKL